MPASQFRSPSEHRIKLTPGDQTCLESSCPNDPHIVQGFELCDPSVYPTHGFVTSAGMTVLILLDGSKYLLKRLDGADKKEHSDTLKANAVVVIPSCIPHSLVSERPGAIVAVRLDPQLALDF